jgi:hypothetical protein
VALLFGGGLIVAIAGVCHTAKMAPVKSGFAADLRLPWRVARIDVD